MSSKLRPFISGTQKYAKKKEHIASAPNINPTLDCKSAYGALSKYGVKNEKRKLYACQQTISVKRE
jgi:hypothetical protein